MVFHYIKYNHKDHRCDLPVSQPPSQKKKTNNNNKRQPSSPQNLEDSDDLVQLSIAASLITHYMITTQEPTIAVEPEHMDTHTHTPVTRADADAWQGTYFMLELFQCTVCLLACTRYTSAQVSVMRYTDNAARAIILRSRFLRACSFSPPHLLPLVTSYPTRWSVENIQVRRKKKNSKKNWEVVLQARGVTLKSSAS